MLKKIFVSAMFAAAFISPFAQAQFKYLEGRDYQTLPETLDEGKAPKMIEFFWYGCPHCYDFEKSLQPWLKSDKSAGIEFEKVPAVIPQWRIGAELYYTAHALNLPNIDTKIFDAIHEHSEYAIIKNKEKAIEFLVANGADKEKAERTWDSLAVQQKVARAKKLFDDSKSNGVPTIVVNGKYVVLPTATEGGHGKLFFDTVSALSRQKSTKSE